MSCRDESEMQRRGEHLRDGVVVSTCMRGDESERQRASIRAALRDGVVVSTCMRDGHHQFAIGDVRDGVVMSTCMRDGHHQFAIGDEDHGANYSNGQRRTPRIEIVKSVVPARGKPSVERASTEGTLPPARRCQVAAAASRTQGHHRLDRGWGSPRNGGAVKK